MPSAPDRAYQKPVQALLLFLVCMLVAAASRSSESRTDAEARLPRPSHDGVRFARAVEQDVDARALHVVDGAARPRTEENLRRSLLVVVVPGVARRRTLHL